MRLLRLSGVLVASVVSAQATIHVPGDVPTIQAAIELAQYGDTVRVAAGTYNELVDFLGKAITVESESGAAATTIDATGLYDSVVSFHQSEGRDSVLRGFTITGGNTSTRAGGISAALGPVATAARPTIESCIIRGNRTQGFFAAGAGGNMLMLDCVIEENYASYSAGGVWGAPRLVRCTVRNNTGYDAGGILLFGGVARDCAITGNYAVEGTYGGGAHLAGSSAVLERCLIASNTGWSVGMSSVLSAGVYVSPGAPGALILNCTIVDNVVVSPHVPPGDNCGGVQGPARLVNTIVRGNDELEIGLQATVTADFCNIEGGHPGLGNFDLDPLFVDPAYGDYHLSALSPCIDAGAPLGPQDPDCTRADVGAFYYPQANVLVRTGRGLNPLILASMTPPRIGTVWHARIDASQVPGVTMSFITGRTRALDPGIVVPQGELLVDGAPVFGASMPSSGTQDDFFFPIPNSTALLGYEGHAQGVVLGSNGLRLGNALHLKLGR